jgi:hypothetical protein
VFQCDTGVSEDKNDYQCSEHSRVRSEIKKITARALGQRVVGLDA